MNRIPIGRIAHRVASIHWDSTRLRFRPKAKSHQGGHSITMSCLLGTKLWRRYFTIQGVGKVKQEIRVYLTFTVISIFPKVMISKLPLQRYPSRKYLLQKYLICLSRKECVAVRRSNARSAGCGWRERIQ
jgi:hypothetical protein